MLALASVSMMLGRMEFTRMPLPFRLRQANQQSTAADLKPHTLPAGGMSIAALTPHYDAPALFNMPHAARESTYPNANSAPASDRKPSSQFHSFVPPRNRPPCSQEHPNAVLFENFFDELAYGSFIRDINQIRKPGSIGTAASFKASALLLSIGDDDRGAFLKNARLTARPNPLYRPQQGSLFQGISHSSQTSASMTFLFSHFVIRNRPVSYPERRYSSKAGSFLDNFEMEGIHAISRAFSSTKATACRPKPRVCSASTYNSSIKRHGRENSKLKLSSAQCIRRSCFLQRAPGPPNAGRERSRRNMRALPARQN